MRALFLFIVCVTAACHYSPPGSCSTSTDCGSGKICSGGVCMGCATGAGCEAWQDCSTAHRCTAKAGMCGENRDCGAWETCEADNLCAAKPGKCTSISDCQAWEVCGTEHVCVFGPGNCNDDTDCSAWQQCETDHSCINSPDDTRSVLLWDVLKILPYKFALAPIGAPEQVSVGFPSTSLNNEDGTAKLSPTGHFFYMQYEDSSAYTTSIREFVAEPMLWNGVSWEYPSDPVANDPVVVPSTACGGAGPYQFVMNAGSGAIYYACPALNSQWDYYDTDGIKRLTVTRLWAWAADDVKLVRSATNGNLAVMDANGTETLIQGLPTFTDVLAARTQPGGFWIVLANSSSGECQRWSINDQGMASLDGHYDLTPGTYSAVCGGVLGSSGGLFTAIITSSYNVVLRREVDGTPASLAYTEENAPAGANDFGSSSFKPYVLLYDSRLVTTP